MGLFAVRNYANVDGHLHRGAQPIEGWEYNWLHGLGVKRIVNLRGEVPNADKDACPAEFPFEFITIGLTDDTAPTQEQAEQFMQLVRDGVPMFWHCQHGHGRTSTFNVLARLAQGWTLEDAMKEERERFGYDFRIPSQVEFLQQFAKDLTLKSAA